MAGFGYMLPMKKPTFKPVYFQGRVDPWAITIPAYLSPSKKIQRRFFYVSAKQRNLAHI